MKIGQDKITHMVVGFMASVVGAGVAAVAGFDPKLGLLLGPVLGAGKEVVWDGLMKKGTPEVLDFIFTSIPAALMFLVMRTV